MTHAHPRQPDYLAPCIWTSMLATFVAALVVTGAGWAWFAVALLTVIAGGDWYFALTEHRRRRARRFEVTDRWLKSLPKDAWPQ